MFEFFKRNKFDLVVHCAAQPSHDRAAVESFSLLERRLGHPVHSKYLDRNRRGDHICYISDVRKLKSHYPDGGSGPPLPTSLRS